MSTSQVSRLEVIAQFRHPAELDAWAAKLVFAGLSGAGMLPAKGECEASEACLARASVLEKYGRWWHLNCLPILQARGYIQLERGRIRTCDDIQQSGIAQA